MSNVPQGSQGIVTQRQNRIIQTPGNTYIPEIKPVSYLPIPYGEPNYIQYNYCDNKRQLEENIPKETLEKMHEFQKKGVRFGINNYGRILLCDEKGLGKKTQALVLAQVYEITWPLLIICPSYLIDNWKHEAIKWIKGLTETDIQVIKQKEESINVIITSYDIAAHKIKNFKVKIAIADRAHQLRGYEKKSNVLVSFLKQMRHVILLTGTPILNKTADLFNLVQIIRPDVFCSFKEFANRYCESMLSSRSDQGNRMYFTNFSELNRKIQSFMIRRLKQDVLDPLPNRIRQNIKVNVDETKTKELVAMIKQNKEQIDLSLVKGTENYDNMNSNQQFHQPQQQDEGIQQQQGKLNKIQEGFMQKCFTQTCGAKMVGVCKSLPNIINDLKNEKIVVFAYHKDMIEQIEKLLSEKEIVYVRVKGKDEKKKQLVKQFENDSYCQVALLSLKKMDDFTLTEESTVIFAELYSAGTIRQAEEIVQLTGKKNCIYLIGENTTDTYLLESLELQERKISSIFDGEYRHQYQKISHIEPPLKKKRKMETLDHILFQDKPLTGNKQPTSKGIEKQPLTEQSKEEENTQLQPKFFGITSTQGQQVDMTPLIKKDDYIQCDQKISLPGPFDQIQESKNEQP